MMIHEETRHSSDRDIRERPHRYEQFHAETGSFYNKGYFPFFDREDGAREIREHSRTDLVNR